MTNYGYIWCEYSWRVSNNASQVWGKKETKFAEIQLPKRWLMENHWSTTSKSMEKKRKNVSQKFSILW